MPPQRSLARNGEINKYCQNTQRDTNKEMMKERMSKNSIKPKFLAI
jgi:hypothetical protein